MIDPKAAGKILEEHFKHVTLDEFRERYERHVLKGRDALPQSSHGPNPAPLNKSQLEELHGEGHITGFGVNEFLAKLKELDGLRDTDTVIRDEVDRIQPTFAEDWPAQLDRHVRNAIIASGIDRPYQHQFDAVVKSLSGADVVMETPTASGKTLAFAAPMLHALKRDPDSHAMMIYPMKALAFDQREQIRRIGDTLSIESWNYDGDTDGSSLGGAGEWSLGQNDSNKAWLRQQPPPILFTNPEYVNASFLGSREAWDRHPEGAKFLRNLRFVVIDEMHEYRGFFGSNMALLLRRFFLHLNRIGANPQVFLSTATCANPQEHARALTGRDVELVSARGVLRPKRSFIFVRPEISDFRSGDVLRLRVEQAALAALEEGLQVLVFCPTKRFLETAFHNARRKAEEAGFGRNQLTAFHADLKAENRQQIQQRIKSGEIRVVFTTNALEIGLDVGGLDGVILAGFPPSIMSAWQQVGRAGRSWDKDAFVLFYAMNDPIDQFFANNLTAFLDKPFDELVVDSGNEELIKRHLPSLVEESGGRVSPSEEEILGTPFYNAAARNTGTVPRRSSPQHRLNLRGGIGQSFALRRNREEVGQISAIRRFREAYIGAIFPFFGQRYHVRSHEEQAVVLEDCEQHLRTEPRFYTFLANADYFDGRGYGNITVNYGALNVVMNFDGYNLVNERTGETLRAGGDKDAHSLDNLHSFWIDLPQSAAAADGIGAIEHMIRVGAMFVIPADRFDTSTYSRTGSELAAYCYENYPGGIGVAKKLFDVWHLALEKGVEVASNCHCAKGCPNCIQPAKSWDISNANIDKVKGIELAQELLTAVRRGPDRQFVDGLMQPI